jgi:transposase
VAVTLQLADRGDTTNLGVTVQEVMDQIADVLEDPEAAASLPDTVLAEIVADKGYHSNAVLKDHAELGIRTYISEPKRGRRRWRNKEAERKATYANRRRIRGERGKRLMRKRGELIERSFAHGYETGGMRRTHLRGHPNIHKRQLIHLAGFNLSLVLRQLLGAGTPRAFQGRRRALAAIVSALLRRPRALSALLNAFRRWTSLLSLSCWHGSAATEAA